ncbi:MAG: hypothetical protein ACI837_002220 [Crocinitomicaceae bacterium]|jgi:hypothetical protein
MSTSNSIRFRSTALWKYSIVVSVILLSGVIVSALIIEYTCSEMLGYSEGVVSLILAVVIAHLISRKWTELTIADHEIKWDKVVIPFNSIHHYTINQSGIGMTALEIVTKNGEIKRISFPNYGKNAERVVEFVNLRMKDFDGYLTDLSSNPFEGSTNTKIIEDED